MEKSGPSPVLLSFLKVVSDNREAVPAKARAENHMNTMPRSPKLVSNSLSTQIRDEIIQMIASRQLASGERLNEVRLADHFGVSRGPIREAARELEGLGYVVSRPRFGFFVVDLKPEEIVDLYEFKDWIERALTADYLRYCSREALVAQKQLLAEIDGTSPLSFSVGLLAFRTKAMLLVHNRFLSQQALHLYRRVSVMSTLVPVENVPQRVNRLMTSQDAYWQALIDSDQGRADQITTEANAFWRQDVAPRFQPKTDGR
jgi:DNA-binding GntR family transcriptional regulator